MILTSNFCLVYLTYIDLSLLFTAAEPAQSGIPPLNIAFRIPIRLDSMAPTSTIPITMVDALNVPAVKMIVATLREQSMIQASNVAFPSKRKSQSEIA